MMEVRRGGRVSGFGYSITQVPRRAKWSVPCTLTASRSPTDIPLFFDYTMWSISIMGGTGTMA